MKFSPKSPQSVVSATPYSNAVDIETDLNGDIVDIGLIDSNNDYHVFNSWEKFLVHCCNYGVQYKTGNTYFAHNGGAFDWVSLIEYLREKSYMDYAQAIMAGTKVIGISVKMKPYSRYSLNGKQAILYLRDSTTLIPMSLKKASEQFNVETPKIKIDCLPHVLKKRDENLYYEYLRADCYALQQVLHGFHKLLNTICPHKKLPATIAAVAMSIFRTKYLKSEYETPSCETDLDYFRSAYHGGRVECFEVGEFVGVYSVDINSLYPSVMLDYGVPIDSEGGYVSSYQKGDTGIYTVKYYQPLGIPVLLDEKSHKFELVGTGTFTSIELERLLELGGSFSVLKGFRFVNKTDKIFTEFVSDIYGMRLQAQHEKNTGLSLVLKLIMNSLYGKFGMKQERTSLIISPMKMDKVCELIENDLTETLTPISSEKGDLYVITKNEPFVYQFPQVAAWITSLARVRLHKLLTELEESGCRVLYTDTDSAYFIGKCPSHLISEKIGFVKYEEKDVSMIIAGKKMYGIKRRDGTEKITAKGIPVGKSNAGYNESCISIDTGSGDTIISSGLSVDLRYNHLRKSVINQTPIWCSFMSFPTLKDNLNSGKKACKKFAKHRTINPLEKT